MMDHPILLVTWLALVAAFLGVTGYRWLLTRHEDDTVHVRDSEANLIPAQSSLAYRTHRLDLWGRALIVTAIVYGLALAAYFMYRQFEQGSRLPGT